MDERVRELENEVAELKRQLRIAKAAVRTTQELRLLLGLDRVPDGVDAEGGLYYDPVSEARVRPE